MAKPRRHMGSADPEWQRKTREKIKASQLMNRLTEHVLNESCMETSQVRAAEILLDRVLPKLSATSMQVEGGEKPIATETKVTIKHVRPGSKSGA